ncbi:hypothetical protein NDU88_004543, partial [Pleurodeles waltl]
SHNAGPEKNEKAASLGREPCNKEMEGSGVVGIQANSIEKEDERSDGESEFAAAPRSGEAALHHPIKTEQVNVARVRSTTVTRKAQHEKRWELRLPQHDIWRRWWAYHHEVVPAPQHAAPLRLCAAPLNAQAQRMQRHAKPQLHQRPARHAQRLAPAAQRSEELLPADQVTTKRPTSPLRYISGQRLTPTATSSAACVFPEGPGSTATPSNFAGTP